ncbi:MAG: tetratricopeptide repeat protein [Chloroflexota bacterium]|nr:tetratricopeptide repeat protein [Chloroflexota bacterium]MDQ5864995.1 tetratricopeptide repeat protein [Chloroflexota bacterium]
MSDEHSFGAYLRQRRKLFGYTQDELAEMAGCSKALIRKIEAGERRPSRQIVELLMEGLEVPPDEQAEFMRLARGEAPPQAATALPASALTSPAVPLPRTAGMSTAAPPAAPAFPGSPGPTEANQAQFATASLVAPSAAATANTPRSGTTDARPASGLPVQLTALIGREEDVSSIGARLLDEDVRLLTLLGPPGIGKTRLAIEVASELQGKFRDGVYFVGLAPISDPGLVIATIAQALGLRETGGQLFAVLLTNYLRDKQTLLVLDTFEQVIEAAPQVVELLTTCPGLKVLVTSREALHVRGERQFPVQPLEMPPPGSRLPASELLTYPAVQLFMERAQAVKPQFELSAENAAAVASICARLDGLPLALELAAARIKLFPAHEIAARLDRSLPLLTGGARDLPARQQTLRGAIQWSYDLLDAEEKELFVRLGVFVGGCDLNGIEAVFQGEEGETYPDIVDLLTQVESLLDKNLIQQVKRHARQSDEPRFSMLETIRQYALERLAESGLEARARAAHAHYYRKLAETAEPELKGAGQAAWLDRLEAEHDNLRAAMSWFAERGEAQCGLQMAGMLWRFWYVRGYFSEGRRWLSQFLSTPGAETRNTTRAKALNGAGNLAYNQADYPTAEGLHEESMSISKELDDRLNFAASLNNIGIILRRRGEYARARLMFEEAIEVNRTIGNPHWQAINLNNLGNVLFDQGDYVSARAYQEESLGIFTALGDEWGIAMSTNDLGRIVFDQGDYATANMLYERSMALQRKMGDRRGIASSLVSMGLAAHHQSDYARARELYDSALSEFRDLGDRRGISEALHSIGKTVNRLGDYPAARALFEESLQIRRELADKRDISESHNNLGIVFLAQGELEQAQEHFVQSLALRRELGNRSTIPTSLNNLALVETSRGNHEQALAYLDEAEAIFRELGRTLGTAIVLMNKGLANLGLGNYQQGHALYSEGLGLFNELSDKLHIATSLARMAGLAAHASQHERAATLSGAAEALLEAINSPMPTIERLHYRPAMQLARTNLGERAFQQAYAKGRALPLDEAISYALQATGLEEATAAR